MVGFNFSCEFLNSRVNLSNEAIFSCSCKCIDKKNVDCKKCRKEINKIKISPEDDFTFENFTKGRFAVQIKTEKDAEEFLNELSENGFVWSDEICYTDIDESIDHGYHKNYSYFLADDSDVVIGVYKSDLYVPVIEYSEEIYKDWFVQTDSGFIF